MSDSTDKEQFKSSLPELKLPENGFQSSLPEHFLANESPAIQWMMKELSKNSQATEFACKVAVAHNEHLRQLNGKTSKNIVAIENIKTDVENLNEQANELKPVANAMTSFSNLWNSKPFKIIFLSGTFFLAGVVYPWYISSPAKIIIGVIKNWIGIE